MCRMFYIGKIDDNEELIALKKKVLFSYVVNSYEKRNRDGYFLALGDKSIRTLDFNEYIEFMMNIEDEELTNAIFGHIRMSTNRVTEKFIHGWRFGKFITAHNGVMSRLGETGNDSLDFFKELFKKRFTLKRFKKLLEERGSGALFIVDMNGNKYLGSVSHTVYIHFLQTKAGGFIVANSNDDIHVLRDDVVLRVVKTYNKQVGILDLERRVSIDKELRFDKVAYKDYRGNVQDGILVLGEDDMPVDLVDINPILPSDRYSWNKNKKGWIYR